MGGEAVSFGPSLGATGFPPSCGFTAGLIPADRAEPIIDVALIDVLYVILEG